MEVLLVYLIDLNAISETRGGGGCFIRWYSQSQTYENSSDATCKVAKPLESDGSRSREIGSAWASDEAMGHQGLIELCIFHNSHKPMTAFQVQPTECSKQLVKYLII